MQVASAAAKDPPRVETCFQFNLFPPVTAIGALALPAAVVQFVLALPIVQVNEVSAVAFLSVKALVLVPPGAALI
mgnify:CR=1 FL=1